MSRVLRCGLLARCSGGRVRRRWVCGTPELSAAECDCMSSRCGRGNRSCLSSARSWGSCNGVLLLSVRRPLSLRIRNGRVGGFFWRATVYIRHQGVMKGGLLFFRIPEQIEDRPLSCGIADSSCCFSDILRSRTCDDSFQRKSARSPKKGSGPIMSSDVIRESGRRRHVRLRPRAR